MESYENVSFDNQQMTQSNKGYGQDQYSFLARVVIALSGGSIKDESQAQYVLAGVGILAVIIAIFVLFKIFDSPTPSSPNENIPMNYPA